MAYCELIEELIKRFHSEIGDNDNSLFQYIVTDNGVVDKTGLIDYLKDWISASSVSDTDKKEYIKALNEAMINDDLFDVLLNEICNRSGNLGYVPRGAINDFWIFYGVAIKKCVGGKAKPISVIEFLDEYPVVSRKQKKAKRKSVTAYNWNDNLFKKENAPLLYEYFMPVIRSNKRKVKTIKKHVSIARKKAKKLMMQDAIARYRLRERAGFTGGTNVIPDEFSQYAKKVNKIL